MEFLRDIMSPEARQWLYRVSLAVIALLGVLGVLTDEVIPAVIGLIGAIFAIGVADGNVNRTTTPEEESGE